MLDFSAAVLGNDTAVLDTARRALLDSMGEDALVSAATTAASFSLVDRAANGIGIFVESMILQPSADFREALGINDFPSASNSLQQV